MCAVHNTKKARAKFPKFRKKTFHLESTRHFTARRIRPYIPNIFMMANEKSSYYSVIVYSAIFDVAIVGEKKKRGRERECKLCSICIFSVDNHPLRNRTSCRTKFATYRLWCYNNPYSKDHFWCTNSQHQHQQRKLCFIHTSTILPISSQRFILWFNHNRQYFTPTPAKCFRITASCWLSFCVISLSF